MRSWNGFPSGRLFLALLWLAGCAQPPVTEEAPTPKMAVLLLGQGAELAHWALPEKLAKDHGWQIGGLGFNELTWEKLAQYNAVVVFDLSRLYDGTRDVNAVEISREGFNRVSELLLRFIHEGGGVYFYGVSYTHMGQDWAAQSLNEFLKQLDAQVLFEELRDPPREQQQPTGQKVLYARADKIQRHPATAGISNLWYAAGPFSYGPWTRPLALGRDWTPLIFTSEAFTSKPLEMKSELGVASTNRASGVTGKRAVIYAARSLGDGRVILSGGESTISFFGYGYSPHADAMWGRVGMEAGLEGIPSDGLKLFVSSLKWLGEPSLKSGALGGFVAPPVPPFQPRVAQPMLWPAMDKVAGELPYKKGVFAVLPAVGGGSGTVAEYVTQAKQLGLDYVAVAGEFEKMERAAWEQLVADCRAATTPEILAAPCLITRDEQDNWFLQGGHASWPKPDRLSTNNVKRVRDHLGYWMSDANFPLRAPFWFSAGQYPTWLHSGYDSFAVRTYQDGRLVDEAVEGFLQNQTQGDRSRILAMNLVASPVALAAVREFTYLLAGNQTQLMEAFTRPQFAGGNISYVSTGPRVHHWYVANATRQTFGEFFVPGTERWRALLKVSSDVPLKLATIYDGTNVFRRLTLSGKEADVIVDGLHDTRHVLAVVVEDEQGGRAMTGSLIVNDAQHVQYFCSDRCNIMGGQSTIREADGRETIVPASSMLYKAGRLYYGTVAQAEGLPGIDGSGGSTQLSISPNFYLITDGDKGEERPPIHRIERPWEAADGLIFDTPVPKRSRMGPHQEVFGHNPYVNLADSKVAARLIQYHFYRKPVYPSPVLADLSLTITDPQGVQLKKGWNDFSLFYGSAWGSLTRYLILRADNTHEAGPATDESTGTAWAGTLHSGDAVLFPGVGEGFFVLAGDLGTRVECIPSKKWFRLYLGRFDTPHLSAGTQSAVRLLNVKFAKAADESTTRQAWIKFRDEYGIGGQPPAYQVTATQGKVTTIRYLLELEGEQFGFAGTITQADLPQRLPIKVAGLNGNWTAAKVDLDRQQWFPLGVWEGNAYTTVDPREGAHRLYLGNLVTADQPDVLLTFLRDPETGRASVDVHNPTPQELAVTVTVPVESFLARRQEKMVRAHAYTTTRVALD